MTTCLPPFGFWSYARKDVDLSDDKRVSQLHKLIQSELSLEYGVPVEIFEDTSDVPYGSEWERKILAAIDRSTFMIPIITPSFLRSKWCFREVKTFLDREAELVSLHPNLRGESLIFPIAYRRIRENEAFDAKTFALLKERQWFRIEDYRDGDLRDPALRREIMKLVNVICGLLLIPVETESERQAREAKEEEERAREATRQRQLAAKRETDRRVSEQAEAKRREADRQRAAEREERDLLAAEAAKAAAARRAAMKEHRASRRKAWRESLRSHAQSIGWAVLVMLVIPAVALAAFFLLRPGSGERSADDVFVNVEAPTTNDAAETPVITDAAAPAPAAHTWLFRRWGIDGDCNTTMEILETPTGFTIDTGEKQYPRDIVGTPTASEVKTDQGTFSRESDGSMRSTERDMRGLRLTECQTTGM